MTRIAALMTAAALALVSAQAASAAPQGGPTSLLLVAPDYDRTASLYHSDQLYESLQRIVQSNESKGVVGSDGWSDTNPRARGPLVRATWLAHDMWVWRIDRIYPQAPGGPWIATTLHDSGTPQNGEKVVWHTTSDPRGLLQILAHLKLLDRDAKNDVVVPTPVPAEPEPAPAQVATQSPSALTGWRWSLVGALAGVLLTVLVLRLTPTWRRRDPSPRWELIDAE